MGLQWPELASKVHEMVGLFCLEFGFKRRIDAVDGLPVDFRRPSVRENVKRAAKSCRFEKGSELFTSVLHGFLNDVAGGISQLSLERRPVRLRLPAILHRRGPSLRRSWRSRPAG